MKNRTRQAPQDTRMVEINARQADGRPIKVYVFRAYVEATKARMALAGDHSFYVAYPVYGPDGRLIYVTVPE